MAMHDAGQELETGVTVYSTPQLRSDVVERQRLLDILNDRPYRLVLVSAPAGFGKTTLALAWLRSCADPVAWVSLSTLDGDPHRFFSQVEAKLSRIDERFSSGLKAALAIRAPAGMLASRLLEDLQRVDRKITLVIDDYQFVESPEIHRLFASLPEHTPEAFRLVVLSRVDPPFPLARLRLSGEALEIRQRDLRFSVDETVSLFEKNVGLRIDRAAAEALEQRTEGWAAGLQMTAISLRHEANVSAFVDNFTGSNLFVVDYLLEEVVQRQSPEMQQFLHRSSILLRFDVRLCRAVTEMEDAARLLSEAETANLFLVQLDEPRGWYRYHRLFAELLSDRLRRLDPVEWDRLHESASVWFEEEGDLASAFYYASQLDTHERLLWLLERHGAVMLDRSEFSTFAKWSERIPLAEATAFPNFLTALIWVRLLTERFSDIDSQLRLAEESIVKAAGRYSPEEQTAMRGTIATQRAYALRLQERFDESVEVTRQALAGPAADDVRNRGLLWFNLGRATAHLGATREAREAFDQAYACTLQARTWYHVLGIPAYLASLASQSESLTIGLECLEGSMTFAGDRQLDDLPAFGFQLNQLGRFLFIRNDLPGAEAAFSKARDLGSSGSIHSVLSNALAGLARVYAARRDFAGAHEMIQELEVLVQTSYPLLYESNLGIERAVLALAEYDNHYLDLWSAEQLEAISDAFTVERESANLVAMQCFLRQGALEEAGTVIEWLETKSARSGRRLSCLIARLGRAVLDYQSDRLDVAVRGTRELLQEAAGQRIVRPFIEFGAPARRLVTEALTSSLAPVVARFAEEILNVNPGNGTSALPVFRQTLADPLTEREQEVLFYLSRELSYQGIADELFVSHDTVKTHVRNIYAKLGVSSRAAALAHARDAGFTLSAPAGA
jgi:LuxR family transcriptional regulator, maltose regulon positive regulatory protein